jgi:hypothetical protein
MATAWRDGVGFAGKFARVRNRRICHAVCSLGMWQVKNEEPTPVAGVLVVADMPVGYRRPGDGLEVGRADWYI